MIESPAGTHRNLCCSVGPHLAGQSALVQRRCISFPGQEFFAAHGAILQDTRPDVDCIQDLFFGIFILSYQGNGYRRFAWNLY